MSINEFYIFLRKNGDRINITLTYFKRPLLDFFA